MIKGNSLRVRKHPARLQRAAWALARVLLLSLTVMIDWLQRNSFAQSPASLIRFAQTQTAIVEHIFRCLLILMRATPAAPKPAPFQPALNDADARTPSTRRYGAPGFLSLSQIAKGFARFGAVPPALDARRPARPPALPPGPYGPTAAAPVADPLELLAARLSGLRAVLEDPTPTLPGWPRCSRRRASRYARPCPSFLMPRCGCSAITPQNPLPFPRPARCPTRPEPHPANSIILPATPCVFRAKLLDSALAPAFPRATPAHSISVKVD